MGVSCYYCTKPCKEPGAGFTEEECLKDFRSHFHGHNEAGICVPRIYHDFIPEQWETLKEFSTIIGITKSSLEIGLKKGFYNNELHYLRPAAGSYQRQVKIILPPETMDAIELHYEQLEQKKYEAEREAALYKKSALKIPENIEELKKEHPLVQNVHFFNTLYFPDLTLREID